MGLPDAFLSESIGEIARNSLKMLSRAQTLQNALAGTCERCIATGAPRVYPCIFLGRAWLVYLVGCPQYRWRRDHREFRCRDAPVRCPNTATQAPLRSPTRSCAVDGGGGSARITAIFSGIREVQAVRGWGKHPYHRCSLKGTHFSVRAPHGQNPLKLRREGGFEHAPSRLSYSSISSNQDKPRRSGYLRCVNFSLRSS